jgi:hypothetical protein
MNTGVKTIEWLYREQLKVDLKWSVRTRKGFRWWADKNAQTIEVIGEDKDPNGNTGYLISVRTDFLCSVELNEDALKAINGVLMPFASMAGPVYDPEMRTLSLCSLLRIYDWTSWWMNRLISVAAVLQIGEARIMGDLMSKMLGAEPAISGHPENGERPEPDEMPEIVANLIGPRGKEPFPWPATEFTDVVDKYMQQPPSLGATTGGATPGGLGFTVEFPYGDVSSLCQVMGDQPHPRYGNGLFLLQSFPVAKLSEAEGAKWALTLNGEEFGRIPNGYGFGSYVYRESRIHFTSFIPNLVCLPGLLPNIYFACAQRARAMSARLANSEWTSDSFDMSHSALGRIVMQPKKCTTKRPKKSAAKRRKKR